MFYYLSFLRPPPLIAHPSHPIPITPQIANDLRTELCPTELDIFYRWIPDSPPAPALTTHSIHSSPTPATRASSSSKLTTWRAANAYKEVRIAPPRNAAEGQRWRLMLSTPSQHDDASIIDLRLAHTDAPGTPLPVLSMPILFSVRVGGTGKKSSSIAAKQERIERHFRIPVAPSNGEPAVPAVAVLSLQERLSFDLDKKIWDSGVGLSYWLTSLAAREDQEPEIARLLFDSEKCNILELGAGTGLVSLVLATLLATGMSDPSRAKITTTDLPSAMELIEHNIFANKHVFEAVQPQAVVLDWDEKCLPEELKDGVDLVVMADVTYNTASFPSLISTLRKLISTSLAPLHLLLGYKERDQAERTLWDMAPDIGIEFKEVARVAGAGGAPIEIYTAKVQLDGASVTH